LFAVVLCLASTFTLAAQRTFVGATGTDNPNCSLPAPCRTFTAAIAATNSGGEIIVLDSAGYGPVTITKSVSIIAPPGIYAGISVSSGNGVTINAPGATVVLRGLSINGQGGANGILVQAADRVRIENCVISNMGAQGIYHQANNAEMIVLDTIVRDNGDGGLALVAQNASIVMDHVRSEHNVNVGFYMAPVVPATFARATISDSTFIYNGGNGIWADTVGSATTNIQVERSTLANNGGDGLRATAGASLARAFATLTRNSIDQNGQNGILANGVVPGMVTVYATENSVNANTGAGIFSTSSGSPGSYVSASGNTGTQGGASGTVLYCSTGGARQLAVPMTLVLGFADATEADSGRTAPIGKSATRAYSGSVKRHPAAAKSAAIPVASTPQKSASPSASVGTPNTPRSMASSVLRRS
jgi:hypothetical protein